jgi:hypothetical protein
MKHMTLSSSKSSSSTSSWISFCGSDPLINSVKKGSSRLSSGVAKRVLAYYSHVAGKEGGRKGRSGEGSWLCWYMSERKDGES